MLDFLCAFGIGDFSCYMFFIYFFFDFTKAVQTQKCSFYLYAWKCNGIKTGFILPYCQDINEGLSFHGVTGWPKAFISRAGRLVHKTSVLTVFIRLSSSPPAPLSHHLKAIEKLIFLRNSQAVSLEA